MPLALKGTNVKTTIFGTLPVTSANVNKKDITIFFLNMTRATNIIMYSFSKILIVRGYAFSIKISTIFITIHGFAYKGGPRGGRGYLRTP